MDFGLTVNQSNKALAELSTHIQQHLSAPGTIKIEGTFRGQPVTHFVNPSTGLNVMRDSSGNLFGGWQVEGKALQHLLATGKLGGGK